MLNGEDRGAAHALGESAKVTASGTDRRRQPDRPRLVVGGHRAQWHTPSEDGTVATWHVAYGRWPMLSPEA
eukprot:6622812-Prymnesium_polylepis.2